MKEKGNVLSISKQDFIRAVSANSNVTQYAVEAVLDGMERTLINIFRGIDEYDKIKVRVTRNIQMGAKMGQPTRRRLPDTGEIMEIESKCTPFCKFLQSFLSAVRNENGEAELEIENEELDGE